ncbi:MAG: fibronectin type III domain-containing protein, partial [Candidatus Portiera sp.]|nr:fibronectin type III domain-containing protein [Portiera sp.]
MIVSSPKAQNPNKNNMNPINMNPINISPLAHLKSTIAIIAIAISTLIAAGCAAGGGGGGDGGGGDPIGEITKELSAFGITEFSVVPRETEFMFSWINPQNPSNRITSYTMIAMGYANFTAINVERSNENKTIAYTGNGTSQNFTYMELTEGSYYEFFIQANYEDGESDNEKPIRVFNGRLLAGVNSDG